MGWRNCFGPSVLAAFGAVAVVVRFCTGVALNLCLDNANNSTTKATTNSNIFPLQNDFVTSPIAKLLIFVLLPIVLFPGVGLLTQTCLCIKHKKKCDFLSFTQVCSLIPSSLLETVGISISPCLFTSNILVVIHVITCLSCVGIFLVVSCLTCHTYRGRNKRVLSSLLQI